MHNFEKIVFEIDSERTNIMAWDDHNVNYEGIEDTLVKNFSDYRLYKVFANKKNKTPVINTNQLYINSSDFRETFSQSLLLPFDGILIDNHLDEFGFPRLKVNGKEISRGIQIASLIRKFNKSIPIAVYSAYPLDNYDAQLLDVSILKIKKSKEPWKETLAPFLKKTKIYKKLRTFYFDSIRKKIEMGEKLSSKATINYVRWWMDNYNSDVYFNIVGDYLWYINCEGSALEQHGNIDTRFKIKRRQNSISKRHGLTSFPEGDNIDESYLANLIEKNNTLPILFPNFRTPELLRANFENYLKRLVNSDGIGNTMFQIQAGRKIAQYYKADPKDSKLADLFFKLNDLGKEEFIHSAHMESWTPTDRIQGIIKGEDDDFIFVDCLIDPVLNLKDEKSFPKILFENLPVIDIDIPVYIVVFEKSGSLKYEVQAALDFDIYEFYQMEEEIDENDEQKMFDSPLFNPTPK